MGTTVAKQMNWTRAQTLAALHVYLQLPFGQLHRGQPRIKQLASWIGRTPSAVALKLVNLASLDPQIRASGRRGMGNASSLDKAIWEELHQKWDPVALEAAAEFEKLSAAHGVTPDEHVPENDQSFDVGRTRSAKVELRVNQWRFRRAVLAGYDATCCISGLRHERLMIASHIVPWSEDTQNRLNPHNGLCLSALHDRAFDQGLITVMPGDYTVRVSDSLLALQGDVFLSNSLLKFDRQRIRLPERFRPAPEFLEKHARRFGFID